MLCILAFTLDTYLVHSVIHMRSSVDQFTVLLLVQSKGARWGLPNKHAQLYSVPNLQRKAYTIPKFEIYQTNSFFFQF